MGVFLILLVLGINFAISWSNASYAGRYWSESKEVGGGFRSWVVCGYVMSVAGFTMVYGYILLLLAPVVLRLTGVEPDIISQVESLASDLIYLLVAVPIILSGFRIWIGSLRTAWEERSLAHIATAGWNSYAQIHNTINFARNAPSAFGRIMETLFDGEGSHSKSGKKSNVLVIILAITIVILAVLGGYFTADAIMKHADAEYDLFDKLNREHCSQYATN